MLTNCPKCGQVLIPEPPEETKKCEECGCEIPSGADSCPNCGCPVTVAEEESTAETQKVEVTKVSLDVDKRKVKKVVISIAGAIVLIAVILAAIFIGKANKAKQAADAYSSTLSICISSMYTGASNAESAATLIHDVWYNTIYEESDSTTDKFTRKNGSGSFYDDFNDSLDNLFDDTVFLAKQMMIKSNQETVAGYMKELKNPPEGYEDAYDAVKDLYEVYCDITECALNPTGSLTSYTSKFNEADSNFVKYYKAASLYQ